MLTEDQRKAYQQAVLDQALKYVKLGLAVFPLEFASKRPFFDKLPLIEEKGEKKHKWEPLADKQPDAEQVRQWFSADLNNIAVIQGAVSGNLVVLDFDEEPVGIPLAEYMMGETLENLGTKTIVAKTKKGAHVYLRTDAPVEYEKFDNLTPPIKMEIRADVHYVVAPPSIHPDSGQPYIFIGSGDQIMNLRKEQYKKWRAVLNEKLEEWPYVREILPWWKEPGRQNLCLGVAAFFRKILEWPQERAERIVCDICLLTRDEEERQRANAVQSTYHKDDLDTIGTQRWLGEDLFNVLKGVPRPEKKKAKAEKKAKVKRKDYPRVADDVWKEALSDTDPDEITVKALPYYYFKNGSIAKELVGSDGNPRFAVYDAPTNTISVVGHLVGDLDEIIIPLWDKAIGPKLGMALPSEPIEYGDANSLYNAILQFALKYYDPVDAEGLSHLKICILYIFLTGFQDKNITYWPIVNMRGQSEGGKGRLAKIMYLLSDRGMWQVAPKLGSLHRAVNDWKPTLCLDEADLKDSSEAADLVQFYNSRATGAIIWRYSTDAQTNQISEVTGPTIMCTRKPFEDDGIESRCLVIQAKPGRRLGQKDGVPYLEPPEMFEEAQRLRNKLLTFWLRNLNTYSIDYYGSVKGPVTARLQGTALELMGMAQKIGLETVVTETLTEISLRVVEQRSESPLGKIIQTIHMLWTDSAKGAPLKSKSEKHTAVDGYYGLMAFLESDIADQSVVDVGPAEVGVAGHKPFSLTNRNDPSKPMSGISIGKYLTQTGIKVDQVRVSSRVSKKVLCIKPDDLEHLCRKYIPAYEHGVILASISSLENFADVLLEKGVPKLESVSGVLDVSDTCEGLPGKLRVDANIGTKSLNISTDSVPVEKKLECVGLTETPETPISKRGVVSPYVTETLETPETKKPTEQLSAITEQNAKNTPASDERFAAERAIKTLNDSGFADINEWCIFKLKERKLDGAKHYSAYHLRLDARAQFPDRREVDQLIDIHFMEMNTVAEFTAKYGNPNNLD